jgi:hypothetical protein
MTLKYKKIYAILLAACLLATHRTQAQEILSPTPTNMVLARQTALNRTQTTPPTAQTLGGLVPLELPFVDDFSQSTPYPNPARWTDAAVYINAHYGVQPPTYGVATFEGLNGAGAPYDNTTTSTYGIADYLTSQPINLASKAPSDSVYLSFFYQPEGLGEKPDQKDSLVLQFKKNNGDWVSLWRKAGTTLQPFEQILIPVRNAVYFHGAFQFRFLNYASLTGNIDHWHIDYIRLAAARTYNSFNIDDVAFRYAPSNVLAPYTQVPYTQFLAMNPWQQPNLNIIAANLSSGARNLDYRYQAYNNNTNALIFSSAPNNVALSPANEFTCTYPTLTIPTTTNTDSLRLQINYTLNTTPDANRSNDTLRQYLDFYNEFAYDDGTAEYAYGLNVSGGQIAYKFRLSTPDTLRAIKMHFAQIVEPMNATFILQIWKNITDPAPIYEQEVTLTPATYTSINDFGTLIRLDTLLAVADSFFVGWQQPTTKLLNVGLDKNNNPQNVRFYNVGGGWLPSNIGGTWLMRPILNATNLIFAGIKNTENDPKISPIKIYPNPVTQGFLVMEIQENHRHTPITICDMQGRTVWQNPANNHQNKITINTTQWAKGVYVLKNAGNCTKIVVQ